MVRVAFEQHGLRAAPLSLPWASTSRAGFGAGDDDSVSAALFRTSFRGPSAPGSGFIVAWHHWHSGLVSPLYVMCVCVMWVLCVHLCYADLSSHALVRHIYVFCICFSCGCKCTCLLVNAFIYVQLWNWAFTLRLFGGSYFDLRVRMALTACVFVWGRRFLLRECILRMNMDNCWTGDTKLQRSNINTVRGLQLHSVCKGEQLFLVQKICLSHCQTETG